MRISQSRQILVCAAALALPAAGIANEPATSSSESPKGFEAISQVIVTGRIVPLHEYLASSQDTSQSELASQSQRSEQTAAQTDLQRETKTSSVADRTATDQSPAPRGQSDLEAAAQAQPTLALIAEEGFIGYRSGEGAYILVFDPQDSEAQAVMASVQRAISGDASTAMASRAREEDQNNDRLQVRGEEGTESERTREPEMDYSNLRAGQVVQVTGKMLSNGNVHAISVKSIEVGGNWDSSSGNRAHEGDYGKSSSDQSGEATDSATTTPSDSETTPSDKPESDE